MAVLPVVSNGDGRQRWTSGLEGLRACLCSGKPSCLSLLKGLRSSREQLLVLGMSLLLRRGFGLALATLGGLPSFSSAPLPALSFALRALTTLLSPPVICWYVMLVPLLSHIPVWPLLPSLPHPCSEPPLALALPAAAPHSSQWVPPEIGIRPCCSACHLGQVLHSQNKFYFSTPTPTLIVRPCPPTGPSASAALLVSQQHSSGTPWPLTKALPWGECPVPVLCTAPGSPPWGLVALSTRLSASSALCSRYILFA